MSVRTYILQRWVARVGTVSLDTERDLSHLDTKQGSLFLFLSLLFRSRPSVKSFALH